MQRAILDFLGQEIAAAKAGLEASLAESCQAATDLATENERQGAQIESQATALAELAAENATQRGRIEQLDAETVRTKHEAALQVEAAEARVHSEQQARETAQVALAKAELRLEALPRLEEESNRRQTALDAERLARTDAKRLAATAEAKAAGLADRLADAQVQNKKTADQNERLTAELVQLRSELKESSLAAHAAQRQLDVLQAELASERNDLQVPAVTRTARTKAPAGT
jgi:chromosome segregation ATPase